jgi:hypothetical protein
MPNMGPAKLKWLYEAAEANVEVNKTKSEPLKENPSMKNRNHGQTIKLNGEQESRFDEVVEQVVAADLPSKVRIKTGKFKGHDTVTLHKDGDIIVSFGKKKAQAILDVINDPAQRNILEEFAGYCDAEVTLPYQSAPSSAKEQTPQTFSEVLAANGVKSDLTVGFDLLDAIVAHLDVQTEMGKEFVMVALECIELFDRKQRDYGSGNITMSGQPGLAYRLMDKACRLQHLIQKREKNAEPPKNESIEDSFLDSANLGMIGILVTRGYWK